MGNRTNPNNISIKVKQIFFLIFLSSALHSQNPLNWVNIQPTGDTTGIKNVLSINFVNDLVGYALISEDNGSNRRLVKTIDGGCHWKKTINATGLYGFDDISYSYFFNEQLGFLSQSDGFTLPDDIYRTIDGGVHWSLISLPGYARGPINMFFTSASKGCYVNPDGEIYKTNNGGISWTMATSPYQCCWNFNFSLFFVNQNIGYMAGVMGAILKTTNGGSSWTQQNSTPTYLTFSSIYFPNANIGYAVGYDTVGKIYKSINAGATWTEIYSNPEWFASVWFTSVDTGYVVGDNGNLFITNNGGTSWTSMPLFNISSFYATHYINFTNSGAAFIAGEAAVFKIPIMPIPNYTISDTSVCSGDSLFFTNFSQHSNIFNWFDNGTFFSDQNSPSFSIQGAGIHTLTLEANSCTLLDSSANTINVLPLPVKPVILSNTDTLIANQQLLFCDGDSISLLSSGIYSSYNWISNTSGSILSLINISNSDTVVLEVTGSNSCVNFSDSIFLKRKPKPISDFNYSINKVDVNFVNSSIYANNYEWFFGDNFSDTLFNPDHEYVPGDYQVILISSNDCGTDTVSKRISIILINQVFPNPANSFISFEINDVIDNNSYFQLYDGLGALVDEQNITSNIMTYNVVNLFNGLYYIRINSKDRILTYKFIKK